MGLANLVCSVCLAAVFSSFLALPRLVAQEQPLPDLAVLIARARANVRSDRELLSQVLIYLERRADIRVSKLGKVATGPMKVYQVYPGAEGIETHRRLTEVDRVPVPKAELDKQDRERQRG